MWLAREDWFAKYRIAKVRAHPQTNRTPNSVRTRAHVRMRGSPGQDMVFCLIVRDIRSLIREEIEMSGKSRKD